MADDHHLWRKNLPADFEGRMGEHWDDEVEIKPILWSAVAIAASVAIAFLFCAWIISSLEALRDKPALSPIAEANERRLPPTPWLQPKPEVEMEHMLAEYEHHLASYGWNDELDGVAHIPVERAMELVLAQNAGRGTSLEGSGLEGSGMEGEVLIIDPANDNVIDGAEPGDGVTDDIGTNVDAEYLEDAGASGH